MPNQASSIIISGFMFIVAVALMVKPFLALRTYYCYPSMEPAAVPHHGLWTNLFQLWTALLVPANISAFMLLYAVSAGAARSYVQPLLALMVPGAIAFILYLFARILHDERKVKQVTLLE